jgi:GNAT superfamily N-acetyltransferase
VVRRATPADAADVAQLLHDFNVEFETPTPGAPAIAQRLERLLAGDVTVALLSGEPAVGVALLTFRPNVWYEGPVVLLDELYVQPQLRDNGLGTELLHHALDLARERGCGNFEINVDEVDVDTRRFYERHGFANVEHGSRLLYYFRELEPEGA